MEKLNRYCVFYMTHSCVCDVRKVDDNESARTIIVPFDAELFYFIQSEMEIEQVKEYCYKEDYTSLLGYEDISYRILKPEDNTIYVIGEMEKDYIYNTYTGAWKEANSFKYWNYKIELISPKELNFQKFKERNCKKREFYARREGTRYYYHYQITLTEDGDIHASSWTSEAGGNFYIWTNYGEVIDILDIVATQNPQVYQEIIKHIDPEEHIYYQNLVNYCKHMINEIKII